jgi:hypothetical protein
MAPVIAPDGSTGEVPIERLQDAIKAGGKPAVWMKAPDGSPGIVPRERALDAINAGGRAFGSLQALQQDDATKAASEAGPPKWYGFTPGNILKNAWEGGKQLVTGAGELGKDLITNPDWVTGKNSTLEKFVIQPSEQQVVKTGQALNAGRPVEAAGHALASAVPFAGPWAASLGEQAGRGDIGGAVGNVAGTVATGAAVANAGKGVAALNDLAAKGAKVVGDIGLRNPDVASIPARLVRGLGQTSPDPQNTIATYQQALPHLADIARDVESAGGRHTAAQVFQSAGAKIQELGRPIEAAIQANASAPAGGSPALDAALRARAKAEAGAPDAITQAGNPNVMKLYAIGQGQGPLTIGEMDTIRRFAADQSGPYYNALNRGDQAAVRAWKEAEAYARNAEYSQLRNLTGLDVDQIQSDRAALIKVQDTAMNMWARDLRQSPTNLAQSIGIPFGASRVIAGGLSTLAGNPGGLMEMASGGAEIGVFATLKEMQSARHTLNSAMTDLAHSNLKAPDYQIPSQQAPTAPTPPPVAGLLPAHREPIVPPAPADTSFVRGIPGEYAQRPAVGLLPEGRRIIAPPPPPDESYVRGVPGEYAQRTPAGLLPAGRQVITPPPPPDESFVRGVPVAPESPQYYRVGPKGIIDYQRPLPLETTPQGAPNANVPTNSSPANVAGAVEPAEINPTPKTGVEPAVSQSFQPSGSIATGSPVNIRVPGSEVSFAAHYDVRDLNELRPSHSGINFQPTRGYELTNDRAYTNAANQGKIVNGAARGKFDPSYITTDNPDATNGPPVIASDGHVLGGNGRTMILQRVYRYNPDGAAQYKDALASKAAQFGIDPAKVQGMKQPVLVRVIDDGEFAKAPAQGMLTDFNRVGTASLTPSEQAISDAKRVSPETLEGINSRVAALGPTATLAGAMADSGPEMIDKLISDGIISPQEKGALVGKAGLTDAGKQRISNLVVGRFFDDPSQLDQTPASIRVKLERLAAPVANAATVPGWDITPQIKEAVNALQEARAHGIENINDLVSQSGMFGNSKYSPEAISIASHMLKDNPLRLVKAARAYAEDAQNAGGKQTGLMPTVSQEQSFKDAFGGAR